MSKTAMRKSLFSPKQFIPMAVGILLYAALTIPFNVFEIFGAGGAIAVKPTVAIPMFFGIVFGPITGFVVGLIGNTLSDFASFGGLFWNWEIGNGLLGAIPGIAYFVLKRTDWTKARGLAIAAVLAVVASVVGVGFAAMSDYIFQIGFALADSALADFYFFAGNYAVNGAILTPILLYAYARATNGRARRVYRAANDPRLREKLAKNHLRRKLLLFTHCRGRSAITFFSIPSALASDTSFTA